MNIKRTVLLFTLLAFSCPANVVANPWFYLFPWLDTIGVESAEQFNQKREIEIFATSRDIVKWIDKKAEEIDTDGTEWIEKKAQAIGEQGEAFIKKTAKSIDKNGSKYIDETADATKKAAEDYIEATADQAYTQGYKFGYKSTIKAAPWIVGGAIVGTATYLCIKNK